MNGWRTIIFSVIVAALGALQAVGVTDWMMLLGDKTSGIVVTAIGGIGVLLRFLTTTPVGGAK